MNGLCKKTRIDFALPSFDFAFTCLDFGWSGHGDGLAIDGKWLQKATEVVGFVGFEGNGFFGTQLFEREEGGDGGGQKWVACVRFGSGKFRKMKNVDLPVRVMEKRQTRRRQKLRSRGEEACAECVLRNSQAKIQGKCRKLGRLVRICSDWLGFLRGQGGKAKGLLMTDYEKTEMVTGSSTRVFRFFSLFFGFSRFSGRGTLGVGCRARVGKDQRDRHDKKRCGWSAFAGICRDLPGSAGLAGSCVVCLRFRNPPRYLGGYGLRVRFSRFGSVYGGAAGKPN